MDDLEYFFPVYGNLGWRLNADPYLLALDFQKRDLDIIADRDGLTQLPCQD
jgi:hypothetical protein